MAHEAGVVPNVLLKSNEVLRRLLLGATDEQLDFPIVYASAKQGFAKLDLKDGSTTMDPLYQTVVDKIPPPKIGSEPYFQFCVANLDYSDYLGRLAYGRIVSGKTKRELGIGSQLPARGRCIEALHGQAVCVADLEKVGVRHARILLDRHDDTRVGGVRASGGVQASSTSESPPLVKIVATHVSSSSRCSSTAVS